MSQFSQWMHSTIKEKENELQALYMLQDKNNDKDQKGQSGSAAALGHVRSLSLRSLLGFRSIH
jgi:hypothetical protein